MPSPSSILYEGVQRLRAMLPEAVAEAEREFKQWRLTQRTVTARSMFPHVRRDNLKALVVYEGSKGGWHADLVLETVPPGVADAMGTPVQSPLRTRDEAVAAGRNILLMALVQELQREQLPSEPEPPLAFVLFGFDILLSSETLGRFDKLPRPWPGYETPANTIIRVALLVARWFPSGVSAEALDALSPEGKRRLMATLHLAALSGVSHFPPHEDRPPAPAEGGAPRRPCAFRRPRLPTHTARAISASCG